MPSQGCDHTTTYSPKKVAERLGVTLSMLVSLSAIFAELLSNEAQQSSHPQYTSYDITTLEQARNLLDQGFNYDQIINYFQPGWPSDPPKVIITKEIIYVENLGSTPSASDPLPDPPGEDPPILDPPPFDDITVDPPEGRISRWV